jgi:hypothetical protein
MRLTTVISKVLGPVLLIRALSILIDRQHFVAMLDGLEREAATVSFSFFPIALLMACITLAVVHTDWSSPAAVLIRIIAWGGILKGSALMLFPSQMVAKAQLLARWGILDVVLVVTCAVGLYFTWFGYVAARRLPAADAPMRAPTGINA